MSETPPPSEIETLRRRLLASSSGTAVARGGRFERWRRLEAEAERLDEELTTLRRGPSVAFSGPTPAPASKPPSRVVAARAASRPTGTRPPERGRGNLAWRLIRGVATRLLGVFLRSLVALRRRALRGVIQDGEETRRSLADLEATVARLDGRVEALEGRFDALERQARIDRLERELRFAEARAERAFLETLVLDLRREIFASEEEVESGDIAEPDG